MNRYPLDYPLQPQVGHSGALLQPNARNDRESQTPSDDGSYLQYTKADNVETEGLCMHVSVPPRKLMRRLAEEANASLIAQTLNTDGTPKRPMNAFMIFARRRRPQVSSENQAMRTGEISKILSKEWNAMEMTDKQFYLDQAKQLKDIFNTKYPDYVYRRRPNNSRKKRRPDSAGRSMDNTVVNDTGIDDLGNGDYDDISPIDNEEVLADPGAALDSRHPRMNSEFPSPYDNSHSRASSYGYSSSDYRPSHGRAPYPSSSQRGTPEIGLDSSRGSHSVAAAQSYPQSHLQSHYDHTQSPASYAADPVHGNGWDSVGSIVRGDHARSAPTNWQSGHGRSHAPHLVKSQSYPVGNQTWGRPGSPSRVRSDNHVTPGYPFPTLNSPFYPGQAQTIDEFSAPSSADSAQSFHSSSTRLSSGSIPGPITPGYENRSYAASPPVSNSYPLHSQRDSHLYNQHSQQTSSLQSLPLSSLSHPHSHQSSSSIMPNPASNFWPKIEGQ